MILKHEIENSAGGMNKTNDTEGTTKFYKEWGELYECLCD
jgi:hypothetical protein